MLSAAFHVLVLVHHLYVVLHLTTVIDFSKSDDDWVHNVMRKFKFRYFTGWNFTVQIVYFMICVLEDAIRHKKIAGGNRREWLRHIKDLIFTSLFFPCTLFVTFLFWILYVYDRELVFPKAADVIVPSWLNHSMHTVIIVALVIEMRITRHRYSKRSLGLAALAAFITIYDVTYFTTYITHGAWLYPLTKVLSWFYRAVFIVVSTISIFGFYILGEYVAEKLVGLNLRRINEKLHST